MKATCWKTKFDGQSAGANRRLDRLGSARPQTAQGTFGAPDLAVHSPWPAGTLELTRRFVAAAHIRHDDVATLTCSRPAGQVAQNAREVFGRHVELRRDPAFRGRQCPERLCAPCALASVVGDETRAATADGPLVELTTRDCTRRLRPAIICRANFGLQPVHRTRPRLAPSAQGHIACCLVRVPASAARKQHWFTKAFSGVRHPVRRRPRDGVVEISWMSP